jgi:hypothetical protein
MMFTVRPETLLPLVGLLQFAAVGAIIMAGGSFMLQARRFASRCFAGGIAFAALDAFVVRYLAIHPQVSVFDLGVVFAGILAIVTFICGYPRAATAIAGLAVAKFVLWLVALQALSVAPWWAVVVIAIVAAPFALLAGIWLLQRTIEWVFGHEVAAHVTANYLIRLLDSTGRGIVWVLAAPFRWSRARTR